MQRIGAEYWTKIWFAKSKEIRLVALEIRSPRPELNLEKWPPRSDEIPVVGQAI